MNAIDVIRESLTDAHPGPMPEHDALCRTFSGWPEEAAKGCNCSVSRNAAARAALAAVEELHRAAGVATQRGPEWITPTVYENLAAAVRRVDGDA